MSHIQILAGLDFQQAHADEALRVPLLQYISEQHMPGPHHFVIPICVCSHWVGIRVEVQESQINITYYDSLAGKPYQQKVLDSAVEVIKQIYARSEIEIITRVPGGYEQQDGSSCGAYLIENIRIDVFQKIRKRDVSAEDLRAKHVKMLQNVDSEPDETQANKRTRHY
jgi:Ulp1 family protease